MPVQRRGRAENLRQDGGGTIFDSGKARPAAIDLRRQGERRSGRSANSRAARHSTPSRPTGGGRGQGRSRRDDQGAPCSIRPWPRPPSPCRSPVSPPRSRQVRLGLAQVTQIDACSETRPFDAVKDQIKTELAQRRRPAPRRKAPRQDRGPALARKTADGRRRRRSACRSRAYETDAAGAAKGAIGRSPGADSGADRGAGPAQGDFRLRRRRRQRFRLPQGRRFSWFEINRRSSPRASCRWTM